MNTTCVTVPTLRVFDLSHGCGPRIDLLEASVSDARGWCDTEHASLDVKSRMLLVACLLSRASAQFCHETYEDHPCPHFTLTGKTAFRSGIELGWSFLRPRMRSSIAKSLHGE